MHPNAFLRTHWRLALRPQVFVAMSFDEPYKRRFSEIIEPAVRSLAPDGQILEAYRVDNSKTGDSILTEIVDGIAHSRLFLADVSAVGRDAVTGLTYRNANVLYEVGLALACRLPEEVLLVRDDREKFLFDVSTVPHLNVNFADVPHARAAIAEALADRLRAQRFSEDARVALAAESITNSEFQTLLQMVDDPPGVARGWPTTGSVLSVYEHALSRLLDKGVIVVAGHFPEGYPGYRLTPLGRQVAARARSGFPSVVRPPEAASSPAAPGPASEATDQNMPDKETP